MIRQPTLLLEFMGLSHFWGKAQFCILVVNKKGWRLVSWMDSRGGEPWGLAEGKGGTLGLQTTRLQTLLEGS